MDYESADLLVERLTEPLWAIETRLEEIRDQLLIANGGIPTAEKPKEAPPGGGEE